MDLLTQIALYQSTSMFFASNNSVGVPVPKTTLGNCLLFLFLLIFITIVISYSYLKTR